MPPLARLLKFLSLIAKYRLHKLPGTSGLPGFLSVFLDLIGLLWISHSCRKLSDGKRLRLALEELGPITIKFGQLLSTRKDFIPTEIAEELQLLQDQVPPFSSPTITEIVERSLGAPSETFFQQLDLEPLASASVAQVHCAQLITGEEVVVKVIRPGVDLIIMRDIRLLKWLASLIEKHLPVGKRLRPVAVINDYEKIILDELNLVNEGANTAQLKRNFENSKTLFVPKIYWHCSCENILVMERIDGIPVSDIDELIAHKINLKKLAETGVEIFFTQVFDHSFFHADMHPGNIFVSRDNPENPQYIAIDCAIIGSLSKDDQQYLARNLLAILQRDYRKVAELHVECGWVPKDTRVHEFEAAMRSVCEPIFEKPLKEISFGHLLIQLFRTAGRFNMEVQPSLVLLQKTLLNVEGLGRQLYPDLDLWTTAMPFLEAWNRKRLDPLNILKSVQDNIPEWIESIPQLPELFLNALKQAGQPDNREELLAKQRNDYLVMAKKRRKRAIMAGLSALMAATVSLHPVVKTLLSDIPVPSLVLGILGVYLLCFRR